MSRTSVILAAGLLAATAGCGTATPPPSEAVPALQTRLSRIDAALADRQYADARQAVAALIREIEVAGTAGWLTTEQADRILAAAARLAADLPQPPRSNPP